MRIVILVSMRRFIIMGAIRYLDQPNGDVVETYVGGNCGISDKVTDIRYTRTGYYMRKFNNFKLNRAGCRWTYAYFSP